MRTGSWILRLAMLALGVGWVVAPAVAETPEEAFLRGNRLYEAGDFAGAAEAYASVRDGGVTSPELEFNLGNAYLKGGEVGRAIVHYRRALILRPGYPNAMDNIKYARALTQDVKPEETTPTRWGWIGALRLGPGRSAFLVFLGFTAFLAVAALRLRRVRDRTWAAILQAGLGVVTLLLAAALLFEWTELHGTEEGVIVVSEVDVRAGPGESYTVSFRLHEGTELEVLRRSSGWLEVKVSDRLEGWVPRDDIVVL